MKTIQFEFNLHTNYAVDSVEARENNVKFASEKKVVHSREIESAKH